ncbi:MAG: RAMP superfamily CRISPR-associated protein, partial [Chloroflexota bacterium]|nr:RAMP superfamily CRISPR-associated protein [Chloroflexota bacterium]
LALTGFEQQEIYLGARKRRGFGRCVVEAWSVQNYVLTKQEELLAWLSAGLSDNGSELDIQPIKPTSGKATVALGVALPTTDQRRQFTIKARFALASPLLIRSEVPIEVNPGAEYPDTTHLRSLRNGNQQTAVLPGTSLAGALRARALRILNTLTSNQKLVHALLDSIFGSDMDRRPDTNYASRLVVEESVIEAHKDNWLVQQRVSIDRFTGGAYDTALFSEAPLTGGEVELRL